MQKRCRCKNTMQKKSNHWSDLLFVRFFFCIVVFPFFFGFCLVCFFVFFFAFAQAFATFSRNHVCPAGPWSDLLFFLFLFAFCPGFSTFFRNHVCPVGPWSDLLFFFARFCISIFCSFQSCFFHFFQLCFFLLFLHVFFLLLPRLHSSFACFLLYFYFSPTAQATGVFSHSKGFGAERSSTKTHSPRFPNRGSQIEVPK